MNPIIAIENARAEVAAGKVRCRESYDRGQGLDMAHLLLASFDYHRECTLLRQAEERLRLLELRYQPANDTGEAFEQNYPRARTHGQLLTALAETLPPIDFQRLKVEAIYSWDAKGDVFHAVARWAQVELAHELRASRAPTPGMTIPLRLQMPLALAQALTVPVKTKGKRSRKKETA